MPTSPVVDTPGYLAEDLGPTIIATSSLMIILCTVFVGLRYWARYLTRTPSGADDVIMPFAWLAQMGLCVVGIFMVKGSGAGRHLLYVAQTDPEEIPKHYKGIMLNEILHPAAVAFPKLCVVLLYLRVFTNKYERIATWATMGLIVAVWFSFTIAALLQCTPFAFNWDKSIPNGRCVDLLALAKSSSVPNIVTDIIVLFLPTRTVVDLKVSMGRRICLLLIFLTGSLGIIASIVRTVVFVTTDMLADTTFSSTALVNWTIIEPGLYLIAACALSFKPLFRMVARALHLQNFVTHTKSALGLPRARTTRSTLVLQQDIHMEAYKSGNSGRFAKLGQGRDEEQKVGFTREATVRHKKSISEGGMSVLVTTTVEVESESEDGEEGNGWVQRPNR